MIDYGTKFCSEEGLEINIKEIDYSEIKTFHWTQEQADKFWEKYFIGYVKNSPQREFASEIIEMLKIQGNKIYIKKKNRGKFTEYCGGTVTDECIQRGKNSSNPAIRKRAIFAQNSRKWK